MPGDPKMKVTTEIFGDKGFYLSASCATAKQVNTLIAYLGSLKEMLEESEARQKAKTAETAGSERVTSSTAQEKQ